ncbi:MAG: hypothetical protein KQI62_09310 [Deltaproteobacteria bacterium]|nr:hypothetical protein [Deltaproteobacteria bacterium]
MHYLPTDASLLFVMGLVAMLAAMGLAALAFRLLLRVMREINHRVKIRRIRSSSQCPHRPLDRSVGPPPRELASS